MECPNCTWLVCCVLLSMWVRPFYHWQILTTSVIMWCRLIFYVFVVTLWLSALHMKIQMRQNNLCCCENDDGI